MSSSTPLNRVIHSFGAELCSFAGRVAASVSALKHAVERPPYAGVQDFRETLEDLEQRVADLTHETQTLERHSVDSLSLEELVAHWALLHQVVQRCIQKLEAHLQQYGYDAPPFHYEGSSLAAAGVDADAAGASLACDLDASPVRDRATRRLSRSLPTSPATKLATAIKSAHARSRLGHSQPSSPLRPERGAAVGSTAAAAGGGAGGPHRPSLDSHASLTPEALLSPGLAAKYGSSTGGSSLPTSLPSGACRDLSADISTAGRSSTGGLLGATPDLPTFPRLGHLGSTSPDTPDLTGLSLGDDQVDTGAAAAGGEDTTGDLYSSLIKSNLAAPGQQAAPAAAPGSPPPQQQQQRARTPRRPGTPGSMLRGPALPAQWHQEKLQELDTLHLTLSQLKRQPSRGASRAGSGCSTPLGGGASPCAPAALFSRLEEVAAAEEMEGVELEGGKGGRQGAGRRHQQQEGEGPRRAPPAAAGGVTGTGSTLEQQRQQWSGLPQQQAAPGGMSPLDSPDLSLPTLATNMGEQESPQLWDKPAPAANDGSGAGGAGSGGSSDLTSLAATPPSAAAAAAGEGVESTPAWEVPSGYDADSPVLSTPVSSTPGGSCGVGSLPLLTPGTHHLLKSARGVFDTGLDASARPKSSIRRPLPCTDLNRLKQAAQQRLQQNPGPPPSLLKQQEQQAASTGKAAASSSNVGGAAAAAGGTGSSRRRAVTAAQEQPQQPQQQQQQRPVEEQRVLRPVQVAQSSQGTSSSKPAKQKLADATAAAAASQAPAAKVAAAAAAKVVQVDELEYGLLPTWCRRQVPLGDLNALLVDMHRAGAGATFSVTDLVRLGCSDARAKAVINCLSKLNKVELQSVAGGTSVCRLKC